MLFDGTVETHSTGILLNSGASDCFLDSKFVERHGIPIRPAYGSVSCGGDVSAPIQGTVQVTVTFPAYSSVLIMFVMKLPPGDKFSCILGQTWLRANKAHLDSENHLASFMVAKQKCTLYCSTFYGHGYSSKLQCN